MFEGQTRTGQLSTVYDGKCHSILRSVVVAKSEKQVKSGKKAVKEVRGTAEEKGEKTAAKTAQGMYFTAQVLNEEAAMQGAAELPLRPASQWVALLRKLPWIQMSMLTDGLNGRKYEV